jgi:hypothetical protein
LIVLGGHQPPLAAPDGGTEGFEHEARHEPIELHRRGRRERADEHREQNETSTRHSGGSSPGLRRKSPSPTQRCMLGGFNRSINSLP